MRKLITLIIITKIALFAEVIYHFSDLSISYLDWSNSTENKTTKKDFNYISLESGIGWNWGDLYGNFSIENPTTSYNADEPDNQRYSAFYVNDFVVGFAYKYYNL
jgi:hypothetical protein